MKRPMVSVVATLSAPIVCMCINHLGAVEQPSTDRRASATVIHTAALALDGVKRRSPTLLLAAAELAAELKRGQLVAGPKAPVSVGTVAPAGGRLPDLDPKALMSLALEYCGDDATLRAAVETMSKRLQSGHRGLIYEQGKDLPKYVAGQTFVVLNREHSGETLEPGESFSVQICASRSTDRRLLRW